MLVWNSAVRFVVFVICFWYVCGTTEARQHPRSRRKGMKYRASCIKYSKESGCLQCRSRMFMIIHHRPNGRQRSDCVHTCPSGFYKVRDKTSKFNQCQPCKTSNCQRCFTQGYCTKCNPGFYEHEGKCVSKCPVDSHYNHYDGSCEKELDCKVSAWSEWTACVPRRSRCTRGKQTRVRRVLQKPTSNGKKCPPRLKNKKKCKIPKENCPPIWAKKVRRKGRKKKHVIESNNSMPLPTSNRVENASGSRHEKGVV